MTNAVPMGLTFDNGHGDCCRPETSKSRLAGRSDLRIEHAWPRWQRSIRPPIVGKPAPTMDRGRMHSAAAESGFRLSGGRRPSLRDERLTAASGRNDGGAGLPSPDRSPRQAFRNQRRRGVGAAGVAFFAAWYPESRKRSGGITPRDGGAPDEGNDGPWQSAFCGSCLWIPTRCLPWTPFQERSTDLVSCTQDHEP